MNKLLGFLFICAAVVSCGKANKFSNDFASAAFINAAPASSAVIPSLNVYIDTFLQTATPYGGSTGYLSLAPGVHRIQLKNSGTLATYLDLTNQTFTTNTAYSYVVYDTLTSPTGTLKAVRLNDTLTLAPSGFVKVRFLNLAPRTAPVDVTFLRTSVTPNDSVTFSNLPYIGSTTPNIQQLSAFRIIPLGSYTVKVKNAGTQVVIASSTTIATSAALAGTAGITGISTLYITGGAQGQLLAFSRFRHYP